MLHENIIKIRDENNLGVVYHELELSFANVQVSVTDIITQRVFQEVEQYNKKAANYQHALVKPKAAEVKINSASKKNKRLINAEKQVEVALSAFLNNGFFMLVDDKQAEELDELITIKPGTTVSFIKLTPLVGG